MSQSEENQDHWGPPVAFHFAYCTEAITNAKPMDTTTFLMEVKRRAKTTDGSRDPLAKAGQLLARIGQTAEGQALMRVLDALATKKGEFRESDVYLFSSDTLALVASLINARMDGRYREEEWRTIGR